MNSGTGTLHTPTPDQGEESRETNLGNRRENQIHRRIELVKLHTSHIYFKGDTPGLGSVLSLL